MTRNGGKANILHRPDIRRTKASGTFIELLLALRHCENRIRRLVYPTGAAARLIEPINHVIRRLTLLPSILIAFFLSPLCGALTLDTTKGLRLDLDSTGHLTRLGLETSNLTLFMNAVFQVADYANHPAPLNLVLNGGFESGFTNWTLTLSSYLTNDHAVFHSGASSALISIPTNVMASSGIGQTLNVSPGSRYRVSFWIRKSATTHNEGAYLLQRQADNSIVPGMDPTNIVLNLTPNTWKHISYDIAVTGLTRKLQFYWNLYLANGSLWVDDVSITQVSQVFQPAIGDFTSITRGYAFTAQITNLSLLLQATLTTNNGMILVQGTLTNQTNFDRAIALEFQVPFSAKGWTWYDDIIDSRSMTQAIVYRNTVSSEAGEGDRSLYPLAVIAGPTNTLGISMAVPMSSSPRAFVLGYDNINTALCYTVYLGLTTNALKSYNSGSFSLVLYPSARQYGFRAGLQTYYAAFSESFKKRRIYEGYYNYANGEQRQSNHTLCLAYTAYFNDSSDFGEGYDDPVGMNASKYDLFMPDPNGTMSGGVPADTAVIACLSTNAVYSSLYPGSNAVVQLVQNTNGAIRYISHTYSQTAPKGWSMELRVNQNPDITGALTNWILSGMTSLLASGSHLPFSYVINSDGAEGWGSTLALDYSTKHLAVTDFSLTFGRLSCQPAILSQVWELYSNFIWPRSEQDHFLFMGNSGGPDDLYAAPFMDIGMEEGPRTAQEYRFYRSLSSHKVWRCWTSITPAAAMVYTDDQFLSQLMNCLHFGFYPALRSTVYGRRTEDFRKYYRVYLPAIEELSAAGWEPVNFATAADTSVTVERFGSFTNDTLHFSVNNLTTNRISTTIYLDGPGLGASAGIFWVAEDLITRQRVPLDSQALTFPVSLTSGQTIALWLGRNTGAWHRAVSQGVYDLLRIQRDFTNDLLAADNQRIANLQTQLNAVSSNDGLLAAHKSIFTNLDVLVSNITTVAPIDLNKLVSRVRSDLSFGIEVAAGIELLTPREVSSAPVQLKIKNPLPGSVGRLSAQAVNGWEYPNKRSGTVTNIPDTLTQGMERTYAVGFSVPAQPVRPLLVYLVRLDGVARGMPFTAYRLLDLNPDAAVSLLPGENL